MMKTLSPCFMTALAFGTAACALLAQPAGGPPRSGSTPPAGGRPSREAFASAPLGKTETEKKILAVLDDMDKNQRRGSLSVPVADGRLLRLLAESTGATNIVEIGTSIGYSGLWFCLGMHDLGGHLTTFEIDAQRVAQAGANFKRAGVEGLVTIVHGDAHQEVSRVKGLIDLLFLDADKEGYVDYLQKLLPRVRPGGLIVAHNMNPSQADPQYLKAITTNAALETLFLNMQATGVGVTLKKR